MSKTIDPIMGDCLKSKYEHKGLEEAYFLSRKEIEAIQDGPISIIRYTNSNQNKRKLRTLTREEENKITQDGREWYLTNNLQSGRKAWVNYVEFLENYSKEILGDQHFSQIEKRD